jgi:hypothetical protein
MRPETIRPDVSSVIILYSTLAIGEWRPYRSGKSGPVLGSNSVKSGGKTDITKFPSLLCPCHQARICCYFPWYLILRRMAKVEYEESIYREDRNRGYLDLNLLC